MKKIIFIVLVLLNTFVWAQSEPLAATLEAFVVTTITNEDGTTEEKFTKADQARPGQIIEYQLLLRNVSNETLPPNNAVITGPIPATTTYIADSARLFSVGLSKRDSSNNVYSVTCKATPALSDANLNSTMTCISSENSQPVSADLVLPGLDLSQMAAISYSADGGQTFSTPPVMIMVENDQGEEVEVEATPEQYTTVRWTILQALEPKQEIIFIYRVTVK